MTIPFVTITHGGVTCTSHIAKNQEPKPPVVDCDKTNQHQILSIVDNNGDTIGKLCIPQGATIA